MSVYSVLVLTLDGYPSSSLVERLSCQGISLVESASLQHAQQELLTRRYSVFVNRCDQVSAVQFEILRFIQNNNLPTRAIISAQSGSIDLAVQLMKEGACDFIVGSAQDSRLSNAILQQSVKIAEQSGEETHNDALSSSNGAQILIGQSQAISDLRSTIKLVAKSNAPVLITGESGTGKEIVARQVHHFSHRSDKPCVALNCAALPSNIIENELFGHERGAFTGAIAKKAGCFELANNGSLFLDEIGDMDLDNQSKLLRVLENKSFRRLGGRDEVFVDVKAIAATNKNLMDAINRGIFRQDLYYRLSVIELEIPPLRERKEDIALLTTYFLGDLSAKYDKIQQSFSEQSMEILSSYYWPGNVRELRNVVERTVVLCPHEEIGMKYLPDRMKPQATKVFMHNQTAVAATDSVNAQSGNSIHINLGSSTQDAERALILKTLASVGYNKSKTAKILGVSRKTLYNKINAFFPDGIEEQNRINELAAINNRFMPPRTDQMGESRRAV